MPVIFYTKEEHDKEVNDLKKDNLELAKLYCQTNNLKCCAARVDTPECAGCPIVSWCIYEYKRYPKSALSG